MACSVHTAARKHAEEPTPASDVNQRRWHTRAPGTARNAFQHNRNEDKLNLSHAGTGTAQLSSVVVERRCRQCFNDNNASQWETVKIRPMLSTKNLNRWIWNLKSEKSETKIYVGDYVGDL